MKILLILLISTMLLGFNFQYAKISYGLKIPRDHIVDYNWSQDANRPSTGKIDDTELSCDDYDCIGDGSEYIGRKTIGIIHLPQMDDYETELGYILALIKLAINRTLGMLAFVALIYMLYNGFLILSSGSDDKNATKGKKGIKTAIIAIAGVGLARLIVSVMIWFIHIITETKVH